jgi:alpha-L-rhamnosidase
VGLSTSDPDVLPIALRTADDSGLIACASDRPTLLWRLRASRDDVLQRGYELQRAPGPDFAEAVVSSGHVIGAFPRGDLPGAALASREVAWCRVRVSTDRGLTAWSEPLRIEGGLYRREDWVARPVSPSFNIARREPAPPPLFRRSFTVREGLTRARLYVSALGVHETWLNGRPVSPDLFDPGWTEYRQRLLYAAYDVAPLLRDGENVLAAAVGDGWWRGNLTWMARRAVYGETTALLAQLELEYADGAREIVATDERWRAAAGGLVAADIYDGCWIDQRLEPSGWRRPGFDDRGWAPVEMLPLPEGLVQRSHGAVRVVQVLEPELAERRPGIIAVDCGQNLAGFLRLTVRASRESTIRVRHAEVLEADGSLHTAALRSARATDDYRIVAGEAVLAPSFTYHGFRYAEIELSEGVELDRVEVCVLSSDLADIGHFACSDARVNRLHENVRWSQRGNFLAIPTDCPQRDERLGWTGDIQVFAPTACANFDSRAFLASWLEDLALEQALDGRVPSTVPNVIQGHDFEYAGVGWGDAATLVPWALYEAYGDGDTLARQFASMRAWVDWGASRLDGDGAWTGDFHLGDWLDPAAPPERPEQAATDRDFIASAYLARSADVVARAAEVVGHGELASRYAALAAKVAAAAWRKWSATLQRTQTGCAMAIVFGIAPPSEIAAVGKRLAELVERGDGRIATGFLGTPLVLPALTRAGQVGAAYRLLLNEAAPGWLYQVAHGATTLWERWDAIQPDGAIHTGAMAAEDAGSMISFNHYAYGAVGAWLYRSLAGIAPDADQPGYRMIRFQPQPGGGLTWAEGSIDTPFGRAAIRWDAGEDGLAIQLEIPPGAQGRLDAPAGWSWPGADAPLGSGVHRMTMPLSRQESAT